MADLSDGAFLTTDVPDELRIGDRFRITNDDTPWFAKGLFEVTATTETGYKLKRISD